MPQRSKLQAAHRRAGVDISDSQKHRVGYAQAKNREKVTDTLPERSSGLQDGTVFDAMQRVLSEEENRIVVLHVLWGYKHREIAALLNCPVGTVTSKYKRAAEKLRQFLKEK